MNISQDENPTSNTFSSLFNKFDCSFVCLMKNYNKMNNFKPKDTSLCFENYFENYSKQCKIDYTSNNDINLCTNSHKCVSPSRKYENEIPIFFSNKQDNRENQIKNTINFNTYDYNNANSVNLDENNNDTNNLTYVNTYDLKDLERFAASFKARRIRLGFTQTNVGVCPFFLLLTKMIVV